MLCYMLGLKTLSYYTFVQSSVESQNFDNSVSSRNTSSKTSAAASQLTDKNPLDSTQKQEKNTENNSNIDETNHTADNSTTNNVALTNVIYNKDTEQQGEFCKMEKGCYFFYY